MLDKEKIRALVQLIESVDEVVKKLDEAYSEKNKENFKKIKNELLLFQKEIVKNLK